MDEDELLDVPPAAPAPLYAFPAGEKGEASAEAACCELDADAAEEAALEPAAWAS